MMCEKAIEKDLSVLCITDHCEANAYYDQGYNRSIVQSCLLTQKAKAVFGDHIELLSGVELGQPMQSLKNAEHALNACNYDFVLASLHNVSGKKDFYYLDYKTEKIGALLYVYYEEIIEMCKWGKFDSLAHLTYPLRYLTEMEKPFDFTPYLDLVDEIFKIIIKKNIALEINASGLRQSLGATMPSGELLERYAKLGGTLVTIGSDAHYARDIGVGIETAMVCAYEAGIKNITVYKNRTARTVPITFH